MKLNTFNAPPTYLFLFLKYLKLETPADRGDQLYNVASSTAFYKMYVAYVLFIL